MSLTSIPSDNLYKFMAIAGLLAMFAVGGYWLLGGRESVVKSINLRYDIDAIARQNKAHGEEIDYYRDVEKDPAKAKLVYIQGQRDIDLKHIEWERAGTINEYLANWNKIVGWMVFVAFLLAFSLTTTGFVLWYTRCQRFQDTILRRQADESRQQSSVPYSEPASRSPQC